MGRMVAGDGEIVDDGIPDPVTADEQYTPPAFRSGAQDQVVESISSSGLRSEAAAGQPGYTTASPQSHRASEIESMDSYNNSFQGPAAPQEQGPPAPNNPDQTQDPNALGSSPNRTPNQYDYPSNTSYTAGDRFNSRGVYGGINALLNSMPAGSTQGMPSTVGYNFSKYSQAKPNPLNDYASFNCLFTLSALSKNQQNSGDIKASNINNIICHTAGDWGNNGDKHVRTDFGKFDYIIDDVIIACLMTPNSATGNSFANKISFKVTEPYSLGLFFLALQTGAQNSGYGNFKEAPYLLMIEFIGYNDEGKSFIDHKLTRYIPILFTNIVLKVNMAGCVYECEAIPYNEVAFRDPYAKAIEEVKISGNSVKELLTGANGLRTHLKKQAQGDKDTDIVDDYDIQFPVKFTDTRDTGNDISKSVCYKDINSSGQVPFPDNNAVFDTVKQIYKNSSITLLSSNGPSREFKFVKGTKIQDIITAIVLRSDFIVKQLLEGQVLTKPNGMVDWFRVETRVEDGGFSKAQNRQVRKYIFRVVPYQVHVSKFLPPNAKAPGYEVVNQSALRVYEYLYTGRNTEIIRLDLTFNMSFFVALPADATQRVGTGDSGLRADAKSTTDKTDYKTSAPTSNARDAVGSSAQTTPTYTPTGSGDEDSKTGQAKTLEALLTAEGDLVELNMDIKGDPYYIYSSGMGNIIKEEESFNELVDGSMNYQSGETDVVIVIRTPIDLDPTTGLYKFSTTVDELSGLYQVIEVESKFNHNRFTQTIKGIRRRVQLGSGSGSKGIVFT
jgi:hypothetical protein